MRDFLSRFRPAGAPGAARAAVPASRTSQLEAELGPVLAMLDGPYAECADIIAAARRDADRIVAAAHSEAAALAATAEQRAADARLAATSAAVTAARTEAANIAEAAAAEAAAARQVLSRRLPGLVQQAVAMIWDLQDSGQLPPGGGAGLAGVPGRRP